MSDVIPSEINAIKELLKNLIEATNNSEHLKTHVRYALGLSGETLEMQQLHALMLKYDKQFDTITSENQNIRKELKVIKYALGAIAAGTPILQVILQLLGLT